MEWFRDHAWETWLAVAILLGAAEMLSLDLIVGMLAAGAVVGMIAALLGLAVGFQVILAGVAAVAMLGLLRPALVKRLHGGPTLQVGHGKLVGHQALVTEEVSALNPGRIRLAGEIWTAQPYSDLDVIAAGRTVEVVEIRGATAFVYPVPELDPPHDELDV